MTGHRHHPPFFGHAPTLLAALSTLLFGATASAQTCPAETECSFEKPNVLIVMDYSSSMVQSDFGSTTRWEAQLDAVRQLLADSSFTNNMHIGLARFGHDPDSAAGTTLNGDTSMPPIVDGFAVDVAFDDPNGNYFDCNAPMLTSAIDALPAPPNGPDFIGTWTRGALSAALGLVEETRASHPEDEARVYEVILMTDGDWNCADSFDQADCDGDPGEPDENPVSMAAMLLSSGVRVHVLAFGDATTAADLDGIAESGGTGAAIDAGSPEELTQALSSVVQEVKDAVIVPECIGGLPRVMVIMDASSSMLVGTAPGETKWDKARFALSGNPAAPTAADPGYVRPLFDRVVQVGSHSVAIEDVVHIGIMAYSLPTTQKLMLQYAPCSRDNIEWAMDPMTSCELPGCFDPYTDPDTALSWTFKNSDVDRNPPFAQTTMSFMPACNSGGPERCIGIMFNTYTGEGVNFARVNIARYQADPGAFNLEPETTFANILVTDGMTSPDSADPVPFLAEMLANGVATYVIGFGDVAELDVPVLDAYAAAGGTGRAVVVDPNVGDSADALADEMASIISALDLDPCCQLNDCSLEPEPPLPLCGNGAVDTGEACDDGEQNGLLGGSCNALCTSTGFCGDGVVSGPEFCDDTNVNDDDECRNDCSGYCGDGTRNGSEQCDDGNTDETDGCFSDCTGDPSKLPPPGGSGGTAGSGGSGAGGASGAGTGASSGAGAAAGAGGASGGAVGSGGTGQGSGAAGGSAASGSGASGERLPDGGLRVGADGADGGAGTGSGSDSGDTGGCACRLGSERPALPWHGAAFGALIFFLRRVRRCKWTIASRRPSAACETTNRGEAAIR